MLSLVWVSRRPIRRFQVFVYHKYCRQAILTCIMQLSALSVRHVTFTLILFSTRFFLSFYVAIILRTYVAYRTCHREYCWYLHTKVLYGREMGYMNLLSFTRLMKDKVLAYTYNYIDVLACDTYVCFFVRVLIYSICIRTRVM